MVTEEYPRELADDDSLILIHDEEQDVERDISMDELNFMTTLVVNSIEPELVLEQFKEWWDDNAGGRIELELLTMDIRNLNTDRAEYVKNMEQNEWSIKNCFIAYPLNSPSAYKVAREIVVESELAIH